MSIETVANAQDALMAELAAAVDAFRTAHPDVSIQGIHYDQSRAVEEDSRFISTITFEANGATISRSHN